MVHAPVAVTVGAPAERGRGQIVEQGAGRVIAARDEGRVDQCDLQIRNLQSADQCLEFGRQVAILDRVFEQHADQVQRVFFQMPGLAHGIAADHAAGPVKDQGPRLCRGQHPFRTGRHVLGLEHAQGIHQRMRIDRGTLSHRCVHGCAGDRLAVGRTVAAEQTHQFRQHRGQLLVDTAIGGIRRVVGITLGSRRLDGSRLDLWRLRVGTGWPWPRRCRCTAAAGLVAQFGQNTGLGQQPIGAIIQWPQCTQPLPLQVLEEDQPHVDRQFGRGQCVAGGMGQLSWCCGVVFVIDRLQAERLGDAPGQCVQVTAERLLAAVDQRIDCQVFFQRVVLDQGQFHPVFDPGTGNGSRRCGQAANKQLFERGLDAGGEQLVDTLAMQAQHPHRIEMRILLRTRPCFVGQIEQVIIGCLQGGIERCAQRFDELGVERARGRCGATRPMHKSRAQRDHIGLRDALLHWGRPGGSHASDCTPGFGE